MNHDVDQIIAQIEARSYCIIPSVITPEKADEARGILEGLLEAEATDATRAAKTQRVGGIAVKHPIFVELMSHPLIVAIWKKYLDEDVICSTWTANTSYPGFGTYGWHPDFPYQWLNYPWPESRISGQTIWLLDDFSAENGGTGIMPGSHKKGHRPPPDMVNEWHPEGEILTGVRGSVMVYHGATWHTARPNNSDKPRSALLGMYTRPCYITQEDMLAQLAFLQDPPEIVQQLMGAKRHQPGIVRNRPPVKRRA